jgi:peptidoglycan/LPS O-acetylase OafA/YrhL
MARVTAGEGQAAPPAGPPSPGGGEEGTTSRAEKPAAVARLRYLPGLDGLRALAVLAVLLYHADVSWLPGGFLGVDVFFVISGYLITSLLLAERSATGRIRLRRFWARRARRLLPALFALLAVVAVVVLAWVPDQQDRLSGDVGSAFTYSTNWYLIFQQESYFAALGRPSLLRHLWSLAVEEQFYVVWPLLFAAGLALYGKRWFPKVVLVGALVSAGLMALLFVPGSDPSRVYFGTDTRAAGLLVGSILAFAWIPGRLSTRPRRVGQAVLTLGALVSLAALVLCAMFASEYGTFLYQGGFLLVALLSALLVATASHPGGAPAKLLGWAPLVWLGVRSYAIYLWHWPVFMLTRPHIDVAFDGPGLLAARLAITLLLADISYRLIEQPFRRGWVRLPRPRPALRLAGAGSVLSIGLLAGAVVVGSWPGGFGPGVLPTVAAAEPVVAPTARSVAPSSTSAAVVVAVVDPGPNRPIVGRSEYDPAPASAVRTPSRARGATVSASAVPKGGSAVLAVDRSTVAVGHVDVGAWNGSADGRTRRPPVAAASARATTTTVPPSPQVVAIGDSVMLGAKPALESRFGPKTLVDAKVSRQLTAAIDIVRGMAEHDRLGDVLVIHMGTNGPFSGEQLDELLAAAADAPRVVVVNSHVPRGWETAVNQMIQEAVPRWPNAVLADWHTLGNKHPEWFWDGIHVGTEGAAAYAGLIAEAMAR